MGEPFYITTAISYPNGPPHIGHAYEAIAADAIARFQRAQGRDVRFQTGTDEHGLKMAQAARAEGVEPRKFATKMSQLFQDMCDTLNVSYDRFIRTSQPDHYRASQAIWAAMEARGDLYLDRYEGWYSVRDEAYYEAEELVDAEDGSKLSPHGSPAEWTVEESWFFKLSKYQQPLLDHYAANPGFIQPDSRRNEVVRFVEGGLKDLSISRTSFDWGVPVPGSNQHVMYVWLDALTNYITGLGYPDDTELWQRYWPADVHLIGKDVVRFHAVYWPAFLMSAGLDLPRQVYGHGFLLSRGEKMSKSVGNVVDPMVLADRFGVDALRYFLLREVSFGQDGSYSAEAIVSRANAELANSFGNLAQRTLSMIYKNLDGVLPIVDGTSEDSGLVGTVATAVRTEMRRDFENFAFSQGIEAWLRAVYACNQYVDRMAPWALRKTDPERMKAVLATLFLCLRDLAIAIRPIVPRSADALLDVMGIPKDDRDFEALNDVNWYLILARSEFKLAAPTPIFPRLELEEEPQEASG
jgi:methionyl-tRNA synthetase